MTSPLISTADLAARLGEPGLRLIDGSWHLDGRDGRPDFEAARIPGATFFDLEASSDQDSDLPHMLPTPTAFATRMGALGIAAEDSIVVYDTVGIRSAARVWWMFRAMGARDVRVLDGGLPKWRSEGLPIESGPASQPSAAVFAPSPQAGLLADIGAVRAALEAGEQVLDARAADRFEGRAPEPRAGLRSGHMPGALNLPFPAVLNPDGTMKRGPELEAAFRSAGVDPDRPVVTTCGSGVTAAILSLGLAVLGRPSRLYDGSWAEWGGRADTEVVPGQRPVEVEEWRMKVEGTIKIGEAARWAGKAAAKLNGYPWTVVIANLVSGGVAAISILLIIVLQALFHLGPWAWLPLGAAGLYASFRIPMAVCRLSALRFALKAYATRGLVDPVPTAYRVEVDAFTSRSGLVETRAPWAAVSDLFLAGPYWVVLAQSHPIYLPRRFFTVPEDERDFIAAMLDRMSPEAVERSVEAATFARPPV